MMNLFRRYISVSLTVALVAGECWGYQPEKTFWAERRAASRRSTPSQTASFSMATLADTLAAQFPTPQIVQSSVPPTLARLLPKGILSRHGNLLAALSGAHGTVRKVSLPTHSGTGDPLVIHIQDVHMNAEAQWNIRQTVRELLKSGKVHVLALEGSTEIIDLQAFVDFPHRRAVEMSADYLLKENKISGPIHAALTAKGQLPRIVGIDDTIHYAANVQAYRDSVPQLEGARRAVKQIAEGIEAQKAQVYSPALMALDKTVSGYRSQKVSLGDYVQEMAAVSTAAHVIARGEMKRSSVDAFLQALTLERTLNFKQVETERTRLIEKLTRTLSTAEINTLMARSLAYRAGQMRYAEFYSELKETCLRKGIVLTAFPAMDAYIRYVLLVDGIDSETLLNDIAALEKAAFGALAKTPEEKALVAQSRRAWLMGKLVDFSLTPPEWAEYRGNAEIDLIPHPALSREERENLSFLSSKRKIALSAFESFYREAQMRDGAMAENLTKNMALSGPAGAPSPVNRRGKQWVKGEVSLPRLLGKVARSVGKANDREANISVLVTGGYHAEGIAQQLTKQGVTVISYVPKIEKIDTAQGSAYLSVFTQEKTPLEKLFQGEKLFLATPAISNSIRKILLPAMVTMGVAYLAGTVSGIDAQLLNATLGGMSVLSIASVSGELVRAKIKGNGRQVEAVAHFESGQLSSVEQTIRGEIYLWKKTSDFIRRHFDMARRVNPKQIAKELVFVLPTLGAIIAGWVADPATHVMGLMVGATPYMLLGLPVFLLYHVGVYRELSKAMEKNSSYRLGALYFLSVATGYVIFSLGSGFVLGALLNAIPLDSSGNIAISAIISAVAMALSSAFVMHRAGNKIFPAPAMGEENNNQKKDINNRLDFMDMMEDKWSDEFHHFKIPELIDSLIDLLLVKGVTADDIVTKIERLVRQAEENANSGKKILPFVLKTLLEVEIKKQKVAEIATKTVGEVGIPNQTPEMVPLDVAIRQHEVSGINFTDDSVTVRVLETFNRELFRIALTESLKVAGISFFLLNGKWVILKKDMNAFVRFLVSLPEVSDSQFPKTKAILKPIIRKLPNSIPEDVVSISTILDMRLEGLYQMWDRGATIYDWAENKLSQILRAADESQIPEIFHWRGMAFYRTNKIGDQPRVNSWGIKRKDIPRFLDFYPPLDSGPECLFSPGWFGPLYSPSLEISKDPPIRLPGSFVYSLVYDYLRSEGVDLANSLKQSPKGEYIFRKNNMALRFFLRFSAGKPRIAMKTLTQRDMIRFVLFVLKERNIPFKGKDERIAKGTPAVFPASQSDSHASLRIASSGLVHVILPGPVSQRSESVERQNAISTGVADIDIGSRKMEFSKKNKLKILRDSILRDPLIRQGVISLKEKWNEIMPGESFEYFLVCLLRHGEFRSRFLSLPGRRNSLSRRVLEAEALELRKWAQVVEKGWYSDIEGDQVGVSPLDMLWSTPPLREENVFLRQVNNAPRNYRISAIRSTQLSLFGKNSDDDFFKYLSNHSSIHPDLRRLWEEWKNLPRPSNFRHKNEWNKRLEDVLYPPEKATGWLGLAAAYGVGIIVGSMAWVKQRIGLDKKNEPDEKLTVSQFAKDFASADNARRAAGAEDFINRAVSLSLGLWALAMVGFPIPTLDALISPNLLAVFLWGSLLFSVFWPLLFVYSHAVGKEKLTSLFGITPDPNIARQLLPTYGVSLIAPLIIVATIHFLFFPLAAIVVGVPLMVAAVFVASEWARRQHIRINAEGSTLSADTLGSSNFQNKGTSPLRLFLLVATAIFLIDQITKYFVLGMLPNTWEFIQNASVGRHFPWSLFSFSPFDEGFVGTRIFEWGNWGILPTAHAPVQIPSSFLIFFGLAGMARWLFNRGVLQSQGIFLSMAVLFGGSTGNVVDMLFWGVAWDWVESPFNIFNFADVAFLFAIIGINIPVGLKIVRRFIQSPAESSKNVPPLKKRWSLLATSALLILGGLFVHYNPRWETDNPAPSSLTALHPKKDITTGVMVAEGKHYNFVEAASDGPHGVMMNTGIRVMKESRLVIEYQHRTTAISENPRIIVRGIDASGLSYHRYFRLPSITGKNETLVMPIPAGELHIIYIHPEAIKLRFYLLQKGSDNKGAGIASLGNREQNDVSPAIVRHGFVNSERAPRRDIPSNARNRHLTRVNERRVKGEVTSVDRFLSRRKGQRAARSLVEQFSTLPATLGAVMPGSDRNLTAQLAGPGVFLVGQETSHQEKDILRTVAQLKTDAEFRAGFVEKLRELTPDLPKEQQYWVAAFVTAATGGQVGLVHLAGNAADVGAFQSFVNSLDKDSSAIRLALVVPAVVALSQEELLNQLTDQGVDVFSVDMDPGGSSGTGIYSKEMLMKLESQKIFQTFIGNANAGVIATIGESAHFATDALSGLGEKSVLRRALENARRWSATLDHLFRLLKAVAQNA